MRTLKSTFQGSLVKKWSLHHHAAPNCKFSLTFDGIWKTFRSKCADDTEKVQCKELGPIKTGCRLTQLPFSYFCAKHRDKQFTFNGGDSIFAMQPKDIKLGRLGKMLTC